MVVLVESDETRAMAPSTKAGAGLGVGLGAVRAPSAEEAEASRAAEDAEVRRRHRLPGVLADEQTGPAKERRAQCCRQRPRQEFWQHSVLRTRGTWRGKTRGGGRGGRKYL